MRIIRKMRRRKAVYWAPAGNDRMGKATFAEPIEIKCRWEDKVSEIVNSEGRTIVTTSIVYPDQVLELTGYLWLIPKGEDMDSVEGLNLTNPKANEGAKEVKAMGQLPDLRDTDVLLTAWLL